VHNGLSTNADRLLTIVQATYVRMEMSGPKSCEALVSTCRLRRSLDGCLALLMDASNFGGPDGVGESGIEPRRSLRETRAS